MVPFVTIVLAIFVSGEKLIHIWRCQNVLSKKTIPGIKAPELVVREKYLYSRNTKRNTDKVTGCQIEVSYP